MDNLIAWRVWRGDKPYSLVHNCYLIKATNKKSAIEKARSLYSVSYDVEVKAEPWFE